MEKDRTRRAGQRFLRYLLGVSNTIARLSFESDLPFSMEMPLSLNRELPLVVLQMTTAKNHSRRYHSLICYMLYVNAEAISETGQGYRGYL